MALLTFPVDVELWATQFNNACDKIVSRQQYRVPLTSNYVYINNNCVVRGLIPIIRVTDYIILLNVTYFRGVC